MVVNRNGGPWGPSPLVALEQKGYAVAPSFLDPAEVDAIYRRFEELKIFVLDRPERYANQLVSHWRERGPVTTEDAQVVGVLVEGLLAGEHLEVAVHVEEHVADEDQAGEGHRDLPDDRGRPRAGSRM